MESVKTFNPEPTYIKANQAITPEVAKTLMELVDERGGKSKWFANPKCLEFQIANPFSDKREENDSKIISVLPELFPLGQSLMRHINWGFKNSGFDVVTGYHGFWILKYEEGGQFEPHCDLDSGPNGIRPVIFATASILLNDDFSGGDIILFDSDGKESIIHSTKDKYSVLVWDGTTRHCVKPITQGNRYSLVIHFTGITK